MTDKKSYMVDIRLELFTEDDEEVKTIRIRDMKHDPLPLSLACDLFDRIQMMTPGEPVKFTPSAKPREPLVENGKMLPGIAETFPNTDYQRLQQTIEDFGKRLDRIEEMIKGLDKEIL